MTNGIKQIKDVLNARHRTTLITLNHVFKASCNRKPSKEVNYCIIAWLILGG